MSSLDDERTDAEVARRIEHVPLKPADTKDAAIYQQIADNFTQDEIISLREQVEKLTKERDEWMLDKCPKLAAQVTIANEQLAALAEQNEKLRTTLENTIIASNLDSTATIAVWRVKEALTLPDLASPVLNKYRVEGMRMTAEICDRGVELPKDQLDEDYEWCAAKIDCANDIRARADELESNK